MKRFWLSLLSLGLVMAFSVSAFAVDVKVGAEYYAAGIYLSETSLAKDTPTHSTAFYYQRLRVGTDFVVSPCLSLVTRFDAMERIWGGNREFPWVADEQSAGTRTENENIAFDLAYIKYVSPIGLFEVGYQKDYEWGTIFDNRTTGPTVGTITYGVPVGPVNVVFQYAKESDLSSSAVTFADTTDLDYDSYRLGAVYNFKNGEAGALLLFNRLATYKDGSPLPMNVAFLADVYKVIPYFKAQIGPVALQGEFEYTFGKAKIEEPYSSYGVDDISIGAWSAFLDATANFGMFYAGGSFVYLSGDDPATDKIEGGSFAGVGINTAGLDWNPCLILFNNDFRYWAGSIWGHSDSYVNSEMQNALFFQGRVGVKPNPKTDIMLSISYATADEKPAPFANMGYGDPTVYGNGDYGWEIDLTGTYKITNNLTYMLGAGYLFTGDYFKGFDYDGADMELSLIHI